jgi:hypothetical protein
MRTELGGLGGAHDGRAKRMLAEPLKAGSPLHEIFLTVIGERDDGLQGGTSFGESARLVDHNGVNVLHGFESLGVLD